MIARASRAQAGEHDAVGDAELGREPLELVAQRPLADDGRASRPGHRASARIASAWFFCSTSRPDGDDQPRAGRQTPLALERRRGRRAAARARRAFGIVATRRACRARRGRRDAGPARDRPAARASRRSRAAAGQSSSGTPCDAHERAAAARGRTSRQRDGDRHRRDCARARAPACTHRTARAHRQRRRRQPPRAARDQRQRERARRRARARARRARPRRRPRGRRPARPAATETSTRSAPPVRELLDHVRGRAQPLVEVDHPPGDAVGGERSATRSAPARPIARRCSGPLGQLVERRAPARRVVELDDQSRLAVGDELRHAADARCRRPAAPAAIASRIDDRQVVAARGQDVDVEPAEPGAQVRDEAVELCVDAEVAGLLFQLAAQRRRAEDLEAHAAQRISARLAASTSTPFQCSRFAAVPTTSGPGGRSLACGRRPTRCRTGSRGCGPREAVASTSSRAIASRRRDHVRRGGSAAAPRGGTSLEPELPSRGRRPAGRRVRSRRASARAPPGRRAACARRGRRCSRPARRPNRPARRSWVWTTSAPSTSGQTRRRAEEVELVRDRRRLRLDAERAETLRHLSRRRRPRAPRPRLPRPPARDEQMRDRAAAGERRDVRRLSSSVGAGVTSARRPRPVDQIAVASAADQPERQEVLLGEEDRADGGDHERDAQRLRVARRPVAAADARPSAARKRRRGRGRTGTSRSARARRRRPGTRCARRRGSASPAAGRSARCSRPGSCPARRRGRVVAREPARPRPTPRSASSRSAARPAASRAARSGTAAGCCGRGAPRRERPRRAAATSMSCMRRRSLTGARSCRRPARRARRARS